jgi:hypothetical protein
LPGGDQVETMIDERDGSRIQWAAVRILFLVCLAAQLYLVFVKSYNWDEFLHYSQVYQLQEGRFTQPFQVLHTRILYWATSVSDDLLTQMITARLFVWTALLLTLSMIYGISREFAGRKASFFAAFAYLTAGYVFTQGFSIRADALAASVLMSALCLLIKGNGKAWNAICVGLLIGVAGMITFKSAFYAPCFAGLLWLKSKRSLSTREAVRTLLVIAVAALASFACLYLYHRTGLVAESMRRSDASNLSLFARWLTFEMPFLRFTVAQVLLAPVFTTCMIAAPFAWRRAGLVKAERIALMSLMAPLVSLIFYRNTFPYYFVFLLAPVSVTLAPLMGLLIRRFGTLLPALILSIGALVMAASEPRDVIERQRALIGYVHREFPQKSGYLDYSQMIADYPRILRFLTSGNGLRTYVEAGVPVIANEIDRGNVPFIIANRAMIRNALEGRPHEEKFLPEDHKALRGQYVQQWGPLWREGVAIPAGRQALNFELRRAGVFTLDGSSLSIDGKLLRHGETIGLSAGRHVAKTSRDGPSILWRGTKLPGPPPNTPVGDVFTQF